MREENEMLRIGILSIVVGLSAIAISLFGLGYTLYQPTDLLTRLILSVSFDAIGVVMFFLVLYVVLKNVKYLRP